MSFSQGITGLAAAAANLDVIGNNIANSATVGFKSGGVAFKDVYAGSKVGLGVGVAGVMQNFTAGSIQLTSRPLDLAITNGSGFFRVAGPDGNNVAFTRNGQFTVDRDGYIVSSTGMRLTGYGVTATGGLAGGTPAALQFPTSEMTPLPTASVSAEFNLDSRNAPPTGGAFDPQDSTTYSYSNALTVFDSLGNPHELGLFFVKTATDNTWDVYATMDGTAVGTPPASISLAFDPDGALATAPAGNGTVSFTGVAVPTGADDLDIDVDLGGSTQFGNTSAVKRLSQDGYTSGSLTSFDIGADGVITGKYSNDQDRLLGQVVLSSFANPNGLESTGNNQWRETGASGQPLTGAPGSGTTLGSLTSGALESANVDLTSELVNLIIAQRSYQANAQTLKTQDQVMQTLVNLR
jgi:flagellar hook protein FlgE